MTEKYSSARQNAEKAFDRAKVETVTRDRVHEELDAAEKARRDKTSRLREARLAQGRATDVERNKS
ncbi:hypothetical protein JNB91_28340 [Rhizobium wenxiniae]|uniref:hypothetical protein n=1 Tax=Rhizobium wenxiniae TaxID=1737357 RepID=UPI001C6E3A84|nr:hypothetical protein [Rhizobium wenxiniae]MBW9091705.1 hypothetical protein [Rhizobium wenxiniae]